MRWQKIKAMVYRDFKIFTRVKYKAVEFFYFPIITILIWGLFSVYAKEFWLEAGMIVLVINMFWSFAYLAQSEVNILMMEDTWSGSLKQILVSGLSSFEYYFSRLVSVGIIAVIVVSLLVLLASAFVDFPSYLGLVLLIVPAVIASMALAGIIGSLIISLGREYGWLAWSSMILLIFLSAPFFPAEILPPVLKELSMVMPFTNIFAGARQLMMEGMVNGVLIVKSFLVAGIYFLVSWPVYGYAFEKARKSGKLARFFS